MTRLDSLPQRFTAGIAVVMTAGLVAALAGGPAIASSASPHLSGDLEPVIIGGTPADISQAPWQVALVFANATSDYLGQFCGGSIVSSWEIVTAAHCVVDEGITTSPSDIRVMTGTSELSTTARTAVSVQAIIVHPDYDAAASDSDIAVLRLSEPIALTEGVQEAIPLQSVPIGAATAQITGWGNTSTSGISYPTGMRIASVSTVADGPCEAAYGAGNINPATMLCAVGPSFTTDTCQGDSGGPLVVQTAGVWYLTGVTSWGNGCAESPYPGVYTEVSTFAAWLDDQIILGPQVSRLAGATRYTTAIEISQAGFPDPVSSTPVVLIASGANFPDALSAGPVAAALGGPLLLTPPGSLPAEVVAEINRLNPDTIIVVGGTASISASVYSALSVLAPVIERVGGADRYETSRLITLEGFPSATTAFVATGSGFPDALAAGAAAGTFGAPVILTPGFPVVAPQDTMDFLDSLGVSSIFVVGGPGVVSDFVVTNLTLTAPTTRLSGADRIATAVRVNQEAFPTVSDFVYLANAYSFPDALAGGVLATRDPGPLYTVPQNCVPASVLDEIARLDAREIRLLGGTVIVSTTVAALRSC